MAAEGRGAECTSARPRRALSSRRGARPNQQERPLTLVVDASALIDVVLGRGLADWARVLASGEELVGPELLWSETTSAIHEQAWRGVVTSEEAADLLVAVESAPIAVRRPRDLRRRAWEIADRMGWAKTYDAEYCALAELVGSGLVTSDGRLRAAGARLGYIETLGEAAARLGG